MKKWLMILNIVVSFVVIPFAAMVKAPKTLGVLATILGTPLGFTAAICVCRY